MPESKTTFGKWKCPECGTILEQIKYVPKKGWLKCPCGAKELLKNCEAV